MSPLSLHTTLNIFFFTLVYYCGTSLLQSAQVICTYVFFPFNMLHGGLILLQKRTSSKDLLFSCFTSFKYEWLSSVSSTNGAP